MEGNGKEALHPQLGVISSNANLRRDMSDFPPLAWFTTRIDPPQCLLNADVFGINKETGERIDLKLGSGAMNMVALQRVALGFPIASIAVTRWCDHPGFGTSEGQELNKSAVEFGDNPDDWNVANAPVDILAATEFWASSSILTPKLKRFDAYLQDVRKMVQSCRKNSDIFIPPSWLTQEQAHELAKHLGVPVRNLT